MPVLGFPDFDSCVEGLMADDPELTKESASAICASAEETIKVIESAGVKLTDEQAHDIFVKEIKQFQESKSSHGEKGELGRLIDKKLDEMVASEDNQNEDGTLIKNKGDFIEEIATAADRSSATIQEIVSGGIGCPPPEVISAISSVIDIAVSTLTKAADCAESKLKLLNKKHSIKHKFSWPVPMLLEPGEEQSMMLFKGVAMQEGEMKRGEIMEKDNLIFATGAMSAAAMFGLALMDIDHFETADQLPAKYLEKYGQELADPYPPAFIIDAMVEENITEPSGKKVAQVEFIGAITNPLVWSMLKQGKFKGCSVVDYYRKEVCDDCNGTDGSCTCQIEGSHFLMNTFILEEVPNADGTWVEPLTEKDIGTIIERPSAELVEQLKLKAIKDPRMRMKTFLLEQNKRRHSAYDLDKYMDTETGQWKEGKSSIIEFLTDEKLLPETTANDMADYLWAHPDALNQYQYENMSPEDLVAWFRHITEKAMAAKIRQMQKQIAALSNLTHNADGLKILKDIDLLGKDEVNYGPGEKGNQCQECRWFFAFDPNDMPGPGACAIVSGDILGTDTCDRFEASPGISEPEPEPAPIEETHQEEEPVPPNEDGSCNEGWELNEDTGMCVKMAEHPEEPIEPDEDGNCPEGWEPVEIDGKPMCRIPEGVPEIQKVKLIKKARLFKLFKTKPKATALVERRPQVKLSIVRKQYEDRKKKLLQQIKDVGMIIGSGRDSMNKMAMLHSYKRQLAEIETTLKKS